MGTAVTGAGKNSAFARQIRLEPIDASGRVSPESLTVAVRAQDLVHATLRRNHAATVGSAPSTLDGRPVVLALMHEAVPDQPSLVEGHEVVQMVVDEYHACACCCVTSTGRTDMCNAGTLGAIVTDGVRNYWLSCWHVFVRSTGEAGDGIDSPGMLGAGCLPTVPVGNVSRFDVPPVNVRTAL